jgi:hypothetical protein
MLQQGFCFVNPTQLLRNLCSEERALIHFYDVREGQFILGYLF